MATQTYQVIIVTGINSSGYDDRGEVADARAKALDMFAHEPELVSALTPTGHNFVQSFCILPTGSGNERGCQLAHRLAVDAFTSWLKMEGDGPDYVAVRWGDNDGPEITHTHEDRYA